MLYTRVGLEMCLTHSDSKQKSASHRCLDLTFDMITASNLAYYVLKQKPDVIYSDAREGNRKSALTLTPTLSFSLSHVLASLEVKVNITSCSQKQFHRVWLKCPP